MKNMARNIVGFVVMAMAVAIIALLFRIEIPEGNRDIALVILGVAIGWAGNVVAFHFGSSEGSKSKSEQIENMASAGIAGDMAQDDTSQEN